MLRPIVALLLCPLLAACAAHAPRTGIAALGVTEDASPWRSAIQPADLARLDALAANWAALRGRVPARARTRLLDPAAGQDQPALTPGSYRCRVTRVRAPLRGAATVRAGTPDFCFVSASGDAFSLVKQTGADPLAGFLYPDGRRYVFLGARQRRTGDNGLGYGQDAARNLVGVVERTGGFRWRLALPGADARSLDLIELTPVPPEQQPAD